MKLLNAQVVAPFTLAVNFSDGTEGFFDCKCYLSSHDGPLLDELRDSKYFGRCFIEAGALCWPNGLALSPERVHALTRDLPAASLPDLSVIPAGPFCYQIVPLRPSEILSDNVDQFGKALREYSYHPGFKEVLCPHWRRTDYGTVRCGLLGREVIDDDTRDARKLIEAHFGVSNALSLFQTDHFLSDEIKVCDHKLESDDVEDASDDN